MAMLVACEPCRQRKRKCDRAVPSCARCASRPHQCVYPPHRLARDQDGSQRSHPREMTANHLYQTWVMQAPEVPVSYPITPHWYMPRLIRHFSEGLGVSRLPTDVNSTAYQLQTLWLQGAVSEPCLFHATLYAGSSFFDLSCGQKQSAITLYHQNEAIRLLNDRLSDPITATDDRTLMAISPLALFAGLNGDRAAADIHQAGLKRLVEMRGGLANLGMEGLTSALVQMNTIIYSISFDLEPGHISPQRTGKPPLALETRIINISPKRLPSYLLMPQIQDLFRDVRSFKQEFTAEQSIPVEERHCYEHLKLYTYPTPTPVFAGPIYYCCYLAAVIFRMIVEDRTHPPSFIRQLDALAGELKASLALTDNELWLRHIPAAYTWVCLTGAAASSESRVRIWFYFKQASAVRLLNVQNEPPYLDDLWAHFHWLRTLRLSLSVQFEVLDEDV